MPSYYKYHASGAVDKVVSLGGNRFYIDSALVVSFTMWAGQQRAPKMKRKKLHPLE